jgi:hypothetical protein
MTVPVVQDNGFSGVCQGFSIIINVIRALGRIDGSYRDFPRAYTDVNGKSFKGVQEFCTPLFYGIREGCGINVTNHHSFKGAFLCTVSISITAGRACSMLAMCPGTSGAPSWIARLLPKKQSMQPDWRGGKEALPNLFVFYKKAKYERRTVNSGGERRVEVMSKRCVPPRFAMDWR